MTDDRIPKDVEDDIAEARAAKARAERDIETLQKIEKQAIPVWRRLDMRRLHNGLGEEYDFSMIPKGVAS